MPLPRKSRRSDALMPRVPHEECWAKTTVDGRPGIPVVQHCRTAGTVASLLSGQLPAWLAAREQARTGVVLAALHDIGKVSPGFQCKCAVWRQERHVTALHCAGLEEDHAKIGQRTLQVVLARNELRFWAAAVGAHHGRLKGDRLPELCDGGPSWEAERQRLIETLVSEFGPLPDDPVDCDACALWFNAGMLAVADWLASDEREFPPTDVLEPSEILARAKRQLARIGFSKTPCIPGKTFTNLFPSLVRGPNALQIALADVVRAPGVYVVESSMGSGKTEAALAAAYNLLASDQATGFYFALPTQTTSNRIHERVAAFVEQLSPGAETRLIHGSSWLQDRTPALSGRQEAALRDRENPHEGRDWFASSRRALLAPYGVGTVDQALLGVVAARHFFVRQFGLAGKVVILDEVHSYDLYTGTLIDRLVARLRELGATVIVLSATLTAARRRQLLGVGASESSVAEYPVISAALNDRVFQRTVAAEPPKAIQVRFKQESDLASECHLRAEQGQCVLWIRNTVNDAQATYRRVIADRKQGGPDVALLHARFPHSRREELEREWLGKLGKEQSLRPKRGCVLVSTQVAEQSVDIDADLLITDLAPTDMLLQRLGRLWRHPRSRPPGCDGPETWVALSEPDLPGLRVASAGDIRAALGRSARVYAPYVLLRTLALWRCRTKLTLPADIPELLEATYAEPADDPEAWCALRREMEERKHKLQERAVTSATVWNVALDDDEGVQTRWGGCRTVPVLLVDTVQQWSAAQGAELRMLDGSTVEARAGGFDFGVAQSIHRNMVRVPRWSVLNHLGRVPRWLGEYIRGELVVCALEGEALQVVPDGGDSGLKYRPDLGVVIPSWRPETARGRVAKEGEDDESYDW